MRYKTECQQKSYVSYLQNKREKKKKKGTKESPLKKSSFQEVHKHTKVEHLETSLS